MKIKIESTQELGQLVRTLRKEQGLRQDDVAGSVRVSENFLAKIERGGQTAQIGKVLSVLSELGIELYADVPESIGVKYETTRKTKRS